MHAYMYIKRLFICFCICIGVCVQTYMYVHMPRCMHKMNMPSGFLQKCGKKQRKNEREEEEEEEEGGRVVACEEDAKYIGTKFSKTRPANTNPKTQEKRRGNGGISAMILLHTCKFVWLRVSLLKLHENVEYYVSLCSFIS